MQTQRMNTLNSLPLELLIEVLHHVRADDLVTLATMPELEKTMMPLISSVYDSELYLMITELPGTNISEIDGADVMKKPFLLAVISKFDESIPQLLKLEAFSNIETSIDARLSVIDDKLSQMPKHMPFSSVLFQNLKELRVEDATLDPSVLNFPTLCTLEMTRCNATTTAGSIRKFRFPSLTVLKVTDSFASVKSSLDFENTPLRSLRLDSIGDLHTLENIHCPTLVKLTLWMGDAQGITALKDIQLENLNQFEYHYNHVNSFKNVLFGKVTELRIKPFGGEDYIETYNFHNFQTPMLRKVRFWVGSRLDVSEFYCPLLETTSVRFRHHRMSDENARELCLALLNKVPNLELQNCERILFHLSAHSLRSLKIHKGRRPFDFSEFVSEKPILFPKVGCLSLFTNVNPINTDLIDKIFPKVRYVDILSITDDGARGVAASQVWYPPSLKYLIVTLRGGLDRYVSIDQTLINLRELNVFLHPSVPNDNMKDTFKLTGSYPQLEHLALRGNMSKIVIDSQLCNLKTLKISLNEELKTFETRHRMDELMSIRCSRKTPYIEDFDRVDAPKLSGIGQSTLMVNNRRYMGPIHERTTRRNKNSVAVFNLEFDEWGIAELMDQQ